MSAVWVAKNPATALKGIETAEATKALGIPIDKEPSDSPERD